MIRSSALAICLLGLSACSGMAMPFTEAQTAPAETPSQLIKLEAFASDHVASRNVTIWLPPNYDPYGAPYPVIYAHDGQNLFEPETSYGGVAWELDDIAEQLVAEDKIRAPIIVGMWNTAETRWLEYMPQKIMDAVPENAFEGNERPVLRSDAYLRFIVEEMKPYINANYNVTTGRDDTVVMGSSMGGLISLYAISEYPDVFSRAACVSTHWSLAQSEGPIADAATDAVISFLQASALEKDLHVLWFDHGTLGLDAYYAQHAGPIEAWFRSAGSNEAEVSFNVYDGTDHNEASWQDRTDEVLIFLLGKED
ncbi:MAG: alpha/beta hydrolase-fold protein [Pseudomonadota bacterium]